MEKVDVILINGANLSGKSALCKAVQTQMEETFLHVAFDSFIAMLPPGNKDRHAFNAMAKGFFCAMAGLVETGNRLIIEHTILDRSWVLSAIRAFQDHDVLFVKLHCPITVLETREKKRYGEIKGIARQQYPSIYKTELTYDLELDSSKETPEAMAAKVCCHHESRDFLAFSVLEDQLNRS